MVNQNIWKDPVYNNICNNRYNVYTVLEYDNKIDLKFQKKSLLILFIKYWNKAMALSDVYKLLDNK